MKKLLTTIMAFAAAATITATANAADISYVANAMNTVDGKTEPVAPGGSFENTTNFPNINIKFSQEGIQCAGSTLKFSSDKGLEKDINVNHMFYDMDPSFEMIVQIGDQNITESGVYTLTIPANFFTAGGNGNAATELKWTYTNTTQQGGGDQKELKITNFTVNGVNMLAESPALDLLQRDVPIVIDIDPIPEAVMLTLKFADEDGNLIRSMEIYNITTNKDIEVDPATGHYKTVVGGRAVNKFLIGKEYTATITGYSTTNANNPANQSWGPKVITFAGASEPYKFSPAKIVSVTPENNSEITDTSTPIVVTFSAPVAEVTCTASEGGQGGAQSEMTDITANADKTVWTIKPGASFWSSSECEWMFLIRAKDADGLVVEGNAGTEATSEYRHTLGCYLAWPTVKISPASGMLEQLYEFTVDEPRGVGFSWTAYPYIVNEAGETVAKADGNSQIQYDAQGRDISTLPMGDFTAVKMTFNLDKAITTPGKYTLICPRASFNIGQEQQADANRYMTIEYTVVPMVAVNVELENFAKASFKVAQGNSVTVALNPNEDWKVATLTHNGKDVLAQVANGAITLKNVTEEANLLATHEYAKEVKVAETGVPTSVTSVEGKTYTVTNDVDCIKIENLTGGEEVNVFTAHGMKVASKVATTTSMEISVPDGQMYIVTINKTAVKVMR